MFDIIQVDAFTNRAFGGNPAAVCVLPEARDAAWMQAVANEMNLSETAFLVKQHDGYDLRWFTPNKEVDLCGHATLASAHVLWETGALTPSETARFHTRSGLLTCTKNDDWIEMDFPALPPTAIAMPTALDEALGTDFTYVGDNGMDYIVAVESAEILHQLAPNMSLLATFPKRGVMVTTQSDDPAYDFMSRYFAPAYDVPEDPVTGSIHCCLGPYWKTQLGKSEFMAYQASARGGILRIRVNGERVKIEGQAVTTIRGQLLADA